MPAHVEHWMWVSDFHGFGMPLLSSGLMPDSSLKNLAAVANALLDPTHKQIVLTRLLTAFKRRHERLRSEAGQIISRCLSQALPRAAGQILHCRGSWRVQSALARPPRHGGPQHQGEARLPPVRTAVAVCVYVYFQLRRVYAPCLLISAWLGPMHGRGSQCQQDSPNRLRWQLWL